MSSCMTRVSLHVVLDLSGIFHYNLITLGWRLDARAVMRTVTTTVTNIALAVSSGTL